MGCLTTYVVVMKRTVYSHKLRTYPPCLMQMLRNVIVPPSNLPYNLENGNREHSHGQAQLIKKLFKGKVSEIILI